MLTDIEMLRKTGGTRPGRFEDILTALSSIISRVGKDKFAAALMAYQQFAVPMFSMLLTREVSKTYSGVFVFILYKSFIPYQICLLCTTGC